MAAAHLRTIEHPKEATSGSPTILSSKARRVRAALAAHWALRLQPPERLTAGSSALGYERASPH